MSGFEDGVQAVAMDVLRGCCDEVRRDRMGNIIGLRKATGIYARAIQQSRAGVIATTIGAPVRYMHSTVQLCHADDMDATVKLLTTLMEHAHELPTEN